MSADFIELWDTVVAGRWVILACALFGLLGGFAYNWYAAPRYKSDALVQVERKQQALEAAIGDIATAFGGAETTVTGEMDLIRSRFVLGRAVENLNLQFRASPLYFPFIGEPIARRYRGKGLNPSLWGLTKYSWGGEKINVTAFEVPPQLLDKEMELVAGEGGAYRLLRREQLLAEGQAGQRLEVPMEGGSLVLFVQELVAHRGQVFLLKKLNIASAVGQVRSKLDLEETGRGSYVLRLTFEGADRAKVAQTLNEIVNTYLRQNVERRSAEAENTLEFLQQQLPALKEKLDTAEAAFNEYRLSQSSIDLTKETEILLDEITNVERERARLEQQRAVLMTRFKAEHPAIREVNLQIEQLGGQLGKASGEAKKLPAMQQELLRLKRDVDVNGQLYLMLLNNAQELQLAKAGTLGNVRVVDYALPAVGAFYPKSLLIIQLGLLIGAIAGVTITIVRGILNAHLNDPTQIEQVVGLPVLATVPFSDFELRLSKASGKPGEPKVLSIKRPEDGAVESLRSLRTSLHFALLRAKNNCVMISGSAPGLGKSFVSVNLAAVLAQGGKKVILIDADMRRGRIHDYWSAQRAPGLSDYIAGAEMSAVLRDSGQENFHYMASGALPPNPSELLLSERFREMIDELCKTYDHVIIDTPPVLAVADSTIIGQSAGACLLVMKSGVHTAKEIDIALKRFEQSGVETAGVILNQVRAGGRYGYKYGYYYYQYDYSRKTEA